MSRIPHPVLSARQRRKEARPQELLDAALDLFVEKGFSATRSEEVAARAGVSKGTLYLYYPSKEELLKAVIRNSLSSEIAEGVDIVRGFEGSMGDLVAHLMHEWWRRIGQTKASGICKIIISEVRNFPEIAAFYLEEVIEPAEAMIASVIERGIAIGEFRDVPVRDVVQVMMAPMLFMMLHQHSLGACAATAGRIEPLKQIDVQIDLMLHGLVAPRVAPRARTTKNRAPATTAKTNGARTRATTQKSKT
jgi:AcrR family transcriptional regulator